MELKFESLGELDQFMQFCAHVGRQIVGSSDVPGELLATAADVKLTAVDAAYAAAGYPGALPPETDPVDVADAHNASLGAPDAPATTDKPKRTRRTKAEMEAERAGNAPAATAAVTAIDSTDSVSASPASSSSETEPRGNPFAQSPATQAILEAPNQSQAILAGMAAMQTGADESPKASRGDRVAALLAEGTLTESLAHLKYCQAFIQKHGMAKYNESFADGLTANIAVYTPEQCALHVAILEELA
jgi:hypothetical protein